MFVWWFCSKLPYHSFWPTCAVVILRQTNKMYKHFTEYSLCFYQCLLFFVQSNTIVFVQSKDLIFNLGGKFSQLITLSNLDRLFVGLIKMSLYDGLGVENNQNKAVGWSPSFAMLKTQLQVCNVVYFYTLFCLNVTISAFLSNFFKMTQIKQYSYRTLSFCKLPFVTFRPFCILVCHMYIGLIVNYISSLRLITATQKHGIAQQSVSTGGHVMIFKFLLQ